MANFGPLAAEIGPVVWGTPANFNAFRVLASLLQRRRSTEANQTCTMFGAPLGCYSIYISGALAPDRNLSGAKCTLRPSLAFSYIGSVTARHSSSRRQPNFATLNRGRHLYSAGRPSRWALAHISSFFFLLFSSPNLSRRRLHVYHTSPRDMALVRI